MNADETWWNQVPGAARLVEDVRSGLAGQKTVWFSGVFPWSDSMYAIIKQKVEDLDSGLRFEFLNLSEETVRVSDYVFELDPHAREDYLPSRNFGEYLAEKNILQDTIIWVEGIDREEDREWINLSAKLAQKNAGLKVVCAGRLVSGNSKNVLSVKNFDYFNEFDTLLYSMYLLNAGNMNPDEKMYVCRLANEIAEGYAEWISSLLEYPRQLLQQPEKYVANVFPDYGEGNLFKAIYEAQIKSLLPKIEQARANLIARLKNILTDFVPYTDEYNMTFEKIEDIELRNIVHFESEGGFSLIPSEHETLHFLYQMRNRIAHRKLVDGADVEKLLKM